MKRIFNKKKLSKKHSKSDADEDAFVKRPNAHEVGFVADYEQVCAANSKVIAMLGVNDGPPMAGPQEPRGSMGTRSSGGSDRSRKRESLARQSSRPSLSDRVAMKFGGLGGGPRRDSKGSTKSTGESTQSEQCQRSPRNSHSAIGKSSDHSRTDHSALSNSSRDVEQERSLGLLPSQDAPDQQDSTVGLSRRTRLDHTQLMFETDFEDMVLRERLKDWASSFRRTDPRFKIFDYFNDVAMSGVNNIEDHGEVTRAALLSPILAMFRRAACFSVWRPTSTEAIQKMMLRRGTGKGLNIKGKSAKSGDLSGYVPFVQINEEQHKKAIKPLPRDAKIRVFYRKREARDMAVESLEVISNEMIDAVEEAKEVLEGSSNPGCTVEEAERRIAWWDAADMSVKIIDDYAGNKGWGPFAKGFGVEISERLLWEGYVCRQKIERPNGSIYDVSRRSEPAYQDMNFGSTRVWKKGDPRTVLWQHADPKKGENPLEPRTLLVAYEENNIVLPVVSDFDCFLVGTRAIQFENPLPEEQIEMQNWCIDHIEGVLNSPGTDPWSKRWLDVLKKNKPTGKGARIPRFGYGDPKTYSVMECAVERLGESGAVRHGAECFNYYFPQDLDDEYLVILGDTDAGKVPWVYLNEEELRELLSERIDKGYTFPLNPKWVLCDPGWKEVYDKLLASTKSNVQESLDCWYPPSSGIRERIEAIYEKHPRGFALNDELDLPASPGLGALRRSTRRLRVNKDRFIEFELEKLRMIQELSEDTI